MEHTAENLKITPEEEERIRQSCDPDTEVFSKTTPACLPTCHNGRIAMAHCLAILMRPSCLCRNEYVRDAITQKCVHTSQCQSHLLV